MSNATATKTKIPAEIKRFLAEANRRGRDWKFIYGSMGQRSIDLSRSLCRECNFIIVFKGECFLFVFVTDKWDVIPLGQPIYWVDPVKYKLENFGSFFEELKRELRGVDLRVGPEANNQGSRFFEAFHPLIKEVIQYFLII